MIINKGLISKQNCSYCQAVFTAATPPGENNFNEIIVNLASRDSASDYFASPIIDTSVDNSSARYIAPFILPRLENTLILSRDHWAF